uniref:Fibrinogen C-terminal domain-containing protein n=1 Tax=Amphimedon queenslandica TaxID=400682 RepID=A0A1X7TKF4_AMPQE
MLAGKLMYSLMIIIVIINTVNGNCPDDEPPPPPSPIPEVPYVISRKFYSPSNTSVNDAPVCAMARDCKEWYDLGAQTSGVYTVRPDDDEPFQVYCQDGYTVFQRRQDGSVDFYRGWIDYENGFGDLTGEFWLGLSKIHRLTKEGSHQLDVYFARQLVYYNSFSVSDRATEYTINLQYSGVYVYSNPKTAGDSMAGRHSLNGMKFSTMDNDNDKHVDNCAMLHHGAWWYNSCSDSNLNGLYSATNETGIFWLDYTSQSTPLPYTRMRIYRES